MINKQSIWLLTLFSLILVLSVYYITMPSDFLEAANSETKKNTEKVTVTEQNETISALKVENNEERNKKITELQTIQTSHKATTEQKNKANEQLKVLKKDKHDSLLANNIMNLVQKNFDSKMYISVKFQK